MDNQRQRLEEWREKKRLAASSKPTTTRPPLQPRQQSNTTTPSCSTSTAAQRPLEPQQQCIPRKHLPLSTRNTTTTSREKEKRPSQPMLDTRNPLPEAKVQAKRDTEDTTDIQKSQRDHPTQRKENAFTAPRSTCPVTSKVIDNEAVSTRRMKPVTRIVQSRYMQSSAPPTHNATIATRKPPLNVSTKRTPTESKNRRLTEPGNTNLENVPLTSPTNDRVPGTCTPRRHLRDLNADEILALPSPAEERSRLRRTSEIRRGNPEFPIMESPPLLPSAVPPLPESKTSTRSEDIDVLGMRLQQWCFLNAQMSKTAEKRSRVAEEQLSAAYVLLARKKEELFYQKSMLRSEQELAALTKETDAQNGILESLAYHMEGFSERYTEFASAIQTASTVLRTSHVATDDLDRVPEAGALCEDVLDILAASHGDSFEEIKRFSNDVKQLFELAQTRIQDLKECRELLEAVERAETMDRSLSIQDVQRITAGVKLCGPLT